MSPEPEMTVPFLDLGAQYNEIRSEVDASIRNVIERAAFIGGQAVASFEEQFADYLNVGNCVGVGNGTDALEIAIESLDLPPQSEIIVPANSFVASAEAVVRTGHRVVFADVLDDYTLDPDDARKRISERTSAIMPVHLYGHPADMSAISRVASEHELRVIEDCAQAHGAEVDGRKVGGLGDVAAFSFYPGKNLGGYGDGGAIVTNSEGLANRARMIGNHGRLTKFGHEIVGRNSRLDGIQAAVLSVKLRHLDDWLHRRRQVAQTYDELLRDINGTVVPLNRPGVRHAYHLYVVRVEERDTVRKALASRGIASGVHYPQAIPELAAFRDKHFDSCKKMKSVEWAATLLSLPIGEHLDMQQTRSVVTALGEVTD